MKGVLWPIKKYNWHCQSDLHGILCLCIQLQVCDISFPEKFDDKERCQEETSVTDKCKETNVRHFGLCGYYILLENLLSTCKTNAVPRGLGMVRTLLFSQQVLSKAYCQDILHQLSLLCLLYDFVIWVCTVLKSHQVQ